MVCAIQRGLIRVLSWQVCENLKMNMALLSRFDLVFILVDKPDAAHDRRISEHILQSHQQRTQGHSIPLSGTSATSSTINSSNKRMRVENEECVIPLEDEGMETLSQRLRRQVRCMDGSRDPAMVHLSAEQMRRYIEYAKVYCHPQLSKQAARVLQQLYLNMRAQSAAAPSQSMPVTTRHLESLIRLAQARARIDLRDEVI